MVVIGDKIDGKKVVGYLCHCKHPKKSHDTKEKIGSRTRVGDHYETAIIFEKNKGKCTELGCKCKEYKKGAVLLEDGSALKYDQYFKCDECNKYLDKKKRWKSFWVTLCEDCAPVYYKRLISEADTDILELEQIEGYLTKNYSDQIKKNVELGIEYDGYDCGTSTLYRDFSIADIITKRLKYLKEKKTEWEVYI